MARRSSTSGEAARTGERAELILTAAAKLFRERGYHATGMDDIGAAADISGPAVYRHFASKEAVLVAVVEQGMRRVNQAFHEVVSTIDGPVDRLRALVRAGVSVTIDQLDITRVFLYERRHVQLEPDHPIRRLDRDNVRMLLEALRGVRPQLPERQARFMLQSVNGLNLSVEYYKPALGRAALEDVLTTMILAALHAGPVLPEVDSPGVPAGRPAAGPLPRASRRETILAEATRLFREHGFGGVGIDDIGAAAGIAGPAVYRHFRNKEALLAAAFSRASGQLAASTARALAMPTAAAALDSLIESYVDIAIANADLIAVYLNERFALGHEQRRAATRDQREYVDEWVLVYRRLRPECHEARARTIVHGVIGLVNGYAQGRLRLPVAQVRALLPELARAALQAADGTTDDSPDNDR